MSDHDILVELSTKEIVRNITWKVNNLAEGIRGQTWDEAQKYIDALCEVLGLGFDDVHSPGLNESPLEWAERIKSYLDAKRDMEREACTRKCDKCRGNGYYCSADGRWGCDCSRSEKCTSCNGKGYVED